MVMMEETYHQMGVEEDETTSNTYTNVLEKSTLRPEVEPFVPKSAGQFLMMGQSPFSLDAPEFVPAYYTGGEMYSWAPAPNQFLVQTVNHPRLLIPRFRRKYIGQQQRNRGTYRNNRDRRYEDSGDEERNNFRYNNKDVDRKYTRSEERSSDQDDSSRRGARSYSNSRQRFNNGKSNTESKQQRNGAVEIHPSEAISITTEHKLLTPQMSQSETPASDEETTPTLVDNNVMSYRAALVGKAAKSVTGSDPVPEKIKTEHEWVQVEKRREDKPIPSEEKDNDKIERSESFNRWDGREEERRPGRGAPGFRGRPKPTRGSGIQLNIFSLVQVSEDKKGKKKKLAASKIKNSSECQKIIVKEKEDKAEPPTVNGKAPYGRLHTRQFREYCAQVVTEELNVTLSAFLSRLREFNDRAYKQGSARRRYCCGLREAEKYLKLKKVRCLVIPPNIEKIVTKGGLDDCVSDIICLSKDQDIPIFFGLNKTLISKLLARPKSTITSAVSIFNYDGAEELWKDVQEKARTAKDLYQKLAEDAEDDSSSSSDGEEFDEDNNEDEILTLDDSHPKFESDELNLSHSRLNGTDNESVSSSFVDSGIENGMISEISSMSLDNGVITDEGEKGHLSDGDR